VPAVIRSAVVDWRLAERVAGRVAGTEPLATSYRAAGLASDFEQATQAAVALVTGTTGLVPAGATRATVVDRPGWVAVNVVAFERLLAPLLDSMGARLTGWGAAPARAVTRTVAGTELGVLLGWMAQKVLGQYDLLVDGEPGATGSGDAVYYVGPNVLALEQRYGFPPAEFRLWLALHEVTHRAQFTGVPWLRGHYLGLVGRVLGGIEPDAGRLIAAVRDLARRDRAERAAVLARSGVAGLLASPDQRAALDDLAGLMSLLEGHGDITMDRAGQGRVPSAERFGRVLRARRASRPAAVRVVHRLTGLEAKLAQYEAGERFVRAVEASRGDAGIARCWERPEHLPTLEEIQDPARWLDRVSA
jgi:coenzyme F420 biosynthesis associated uncharacterized protein